MADTRDPRETILVHEGDARVVVYPDSPEDRLSAIAGSSSAAASYFSITTNQAEFLAERQQAFNR